MLTPFYDAALPAQVNGCKTKTMRRLLPPSTAAMSVPRKSPPPSPRVFCQIARSSTSTTNLLHSEEKVVAFEDINPSSFRHYLVIPVEHIPTVRDLTRRAEDYNLAKSIEYITELKL